MPWTQLDNFKTNQGFLIKKKINYFSKQFGKKIILCKCVIKTLTKFLGFSYINGSVYLFSVNILPMAETVLQKP